LNLSFGKQNVFLFEPLTVMFETRTHIPNCRQAIKLCWINFHATKSCPSWFDPHHPLRILKDLPQKTRPH